MKKLWWHKTPFDTMGIVMGERGSLLYGHDHGALQWAPMWFKHAIVHVWNIFICMFKGHDPLGEAMYTHHAVPGPPTCINCSAVLKIDGRYVTEEEIAQHDEIIYQRWEEEDKKWAAEHPEWGDDDNYFDGEDEPKP